MTELERALEELRVDYSNLGTIDYQGIAFFWNMEYKHILRDASRDVRVGVHSILLDENLPLNGVSDKHYEIIKHQQNYWNTFNNL